MTRNKAIEFIQSTDGLFFSVEFIKRTTGEKRVMLARTGVRKHLKGGDAAYNFTDHGLISVFDMEKGQYRSIPKEGITKLNGEDVT